METSTFVLVAVGQSIPIDSEDTFIDTTSDDYYARSGDMLEATSTDSGDSSVGDFSSITTSVVTTLKSPIVEKEEV